MCICLEVAPTNTLASGHPPPSHVPDIIVELEQDVMDPVPLPQPQRQRDGCKTLDTYPCCCDSPVPAASPLLLLLLLTDPASMPPALTPLTTCSTSKRLILSSVACSTRQDVLRVMFNRSAVVPPKDGEGSRCVATPEELTAAAEKEAASGNVRRRW